MPDTSRSLLQIAEAARYGDIAPADLRRLADAFTNLVRRLPQLPMCRLDWVPEAQSAGRFELRNPHLLRLWEAKLEVDDGQWHLVYSDGASRFRITRPTLAEAEERLLYVRESSLERHPLRVFAGALQAEGLVTAAERSAITQAADQPEAPPAEPESLADRLAGDTGAEDRISEDGGCLRLWYIDTPAPVDDLRAALRPGAGQSGDSEFCGFFARRSNMAYTVGVMMTDSGLTEGDAIQIRHVDLDAPVRPGTPFAVMVDFDGDAGGNFRIVPSIADAARELATLDDTAGLAVFESELGKFFFIHRQSQPGQDDAPAAILSAADCIAMLQANPAVLAAP